MSRTTRSFTLIELLVVVAIIGILATFIIASLGGASNSGREKATRALLLTLQTQIEAYSNDFHDYPPSRLSRMGVTEQVNNLNEGVECLLIALTTKSKNGPYFEPKEQDTGNTDEDKVSVSFNSLFAGPELYELLDAWGQPIVYIHNRNYARRSKTIGLMNGNLPAEYSVSGKKAAKTGQYHGFTSFQLFSLGADGRFGTEDDISIHD